MTHHHPADPELAYVARRWPASVRAHLTAEYRRLAGAEDLTGAAGGMVWLHELGDDPASWGELTGRTVVSVAQLVRFADLAAVAAVLVTSLGPRGRLALVEPTGTVGVWPLLRASASALRPSLRGGHLNRDVPWALRHAGMRFTRIERSTVPGAPWALRAVATGLAQVDPARTPQAMMVR